MRKLALATLTVLFAAGAAQGADLPVKARAITPTSLYDTGGWYIGLDSGASVANANVSGSNSLFLNGFANGSLHADGGYVGGAFGYMRGNPANWYAAECDVDYRNITAGVNAPGVAVSVASRWEASCEGRIGGTYDPLSLVANAINQVGIGNLSFPSFNPIPPPGAHVAAAPRTYAALGVDVFGVDGDIGVTGGSTVDVAPMFKIGALWQQLDSTGKPTGGVFDVYGKIVLASKGVSFTHVFDPQTGAMFAGSTGIGNTYSIGLAYKFAPGGITIASK